MIVEIKTLISN